MKTLSDPLGKQEILDRFGRVRPETARRWGKMNAAQMICHVSDAFLGVMGEKAMEMPTGLNLWPWMKGFVLYAPMKWPHGVPTRPEFAQEAGGTKPAEFDADVRTLRETIEKFTRTPRTFEFRPHPMFREMSEKQWMRWAYLHCDHHLRQFGQ